MANAERKAGWMAKSSLSLDRLNETVDSWKIDRSQIVAITEP
jgi:hypothetical protein